MTRSTLFPAAPGASTSTVINGATVVTLAFDAEGVVAAAAGPVAVTGARIEGTDTVVLDVVTPREGLRASVVGTDGTARVESGQLVYTVAGGLPASGGASILLTSRESTKRADNTLAPAPPAGLVYAERQGQTGTLTMTLDARTQAVRAEYYDPPPDGDAARGGVLVRPFWLPLRVDAAGPGERALALLPHEDATGRRFRAVALRTVAGDLLASSPSAVAYRNRAPVSAGNVPVTLYTGNKVERVPLAGIISDPDGFPITFRVLSPLETGSKDGLPSWITRDGDTLVVETLTPRATVVLTVLGVDDRGTTATATLTLSVRTLTLTAPTAVRYTP